MFQSNECIMYYSFLFANFSMNFQIINNYNTDNEYHDECDYHCPIDYIRNKINYWLFACNLIRFIDHHTSYPTKISFVYIMGKF